MEILEFGDTVGVFQANCPAQPPPTEPVRISSGSDGGLNIPFRREDGGFDLYTYNPDTEMGTLLVTVTCEQQTAAAEVAARQFAIEPSVVIFRGEDYLGRPVTVSFVWPNLIRVSGFFIEGKPHSFTFQACVDGRDLGIARPDIPTETPSAPQLQILGTCAGGTGFIVTNLGSNMPGAVSYEFTVYGEKSTIGSLFLGADQSTVIMHENVQTRATLALGGVIDGRPAFNSSGGGGGSVDCGGATPTPVPGVPRLSVSGQCQNGNAVFTVTNNGGDQIAPVPYTVTFPDHAREDESGIIAALNLRSGASISIIIAPRAILVFNVARFVISNVNPVQVTCEGINLDF